MHWQVAILMCLHSMSTILLKTLACISAFFCTSIMAVSLEWTVKVISESSSKGWTVPSALLKKVQKDGLAWDYWLQLRASSPGLLPFLFSRHLALKL